MQRQRGGKIVARTMVHPAEIKTTLECRQRSGGTGRGQPGGLNPGTGGESCMQCLCVRAELYLEAACQARRDRQCVCKLTTAEPKKPGRRRRCTYRTQCAGCVPARIVVVVTDCLAQTDDGLIADHMGIE